MKGCEFMENKSEIIKAAMEIGALAGELHPQNQAYVLNTISALLYSQKVVECEKLKNSDKKIC